MTDVDVQAEPLTVRIREACRMTGIGRSKFYELIAAGESEVVRIGGMTLVPLESLRWSRCSSKHCYLRNPSSPGSALHGSRFESLVAAMPVPVCARPSLAISPTIRAMLARHNALTAPAD